MFVRYVCIICMYLCVHRMCQTASYEWSVSQHQVTGYIHTKTCRRGRNGGETWVTVLLIYSLVELCPCCTVGVSQPSSAVGTEILPEHHKPLSEDHFLVELVLLVLQTSSTLGFPQARGDQSQVHTSRNKPLPAHTVGSMSSSLPENK